MTSGADRTAASAIRRVGATLLGFDGERVAMVAIVVTDELPEIVIFDGEPYLNRPLGETGHPHEIAYYRRVRAFRAVSGGRNT